MKSEDMESHPVPTPTGTSTKIATPTELQQKGSFQFDELHLLLICLVLALGSIIIWLILKLMKNNSIANHHGQQLEMAVVNIGPSDDYQNLPTAPANDDGVHNASGEYQEIPDDSDDVILPLQPAERNNDILALSPALPPRNVVHAEMQPALPARNVVHAKILPPLPSIRNDENAAHGQQLEMAVVNIEPSDDYLKLRAAPANDDGVHNTSGEYQEIPHDSDDVILPLQPAGTSDDKVVLSPALPPRNVVHAKILPALPSIRNDENADQGQELEMSAVNVESSDVSQEIPAAPANDGDGANPPMQPTDHYLLMHPILPTSNVVHAEMDDNNIAPAEPAPLPPLLPRIRSLPRANLASGPVAEPGSSGVSQQIPAAPAAKEYVYEDMRAPVILEVSSSEERLAEEDAAPVAGPEPLHLNGRPPTQDGLEMSTVNYESSDVSQEIPAAPENDGDNPPMQPADHYLLMHPILPTNNVMHAEMDDSNIAPAEPAPLPPLLPRIRSLPRVNLASGPVAEPGSSGVSQQIPAAPAAKEYVYEDMRAPLILEVSSSEERLAEEDAASVAGPEPLHLNGRPPSQDGLEMAAVNYESSGACQEIPAAPAEPANDGDGANLPLQPTERNNENVPLSLALPITRNGENAEMDDSNVVPAEPAPLPPDRPKISSPPRANLAQAAPAPVAEPEPLKHNGKPPSQEGLVKEEDEQTHH